MYFGAYGDGLHSGSAMGMLSNTEAEAGVGSGMAKPCWPLVCKISCQMHEGQGEHSRASHEMHQMPVCIGLV